MFAIAGLLIVTGLFVAMLAMQALGRRLGERHRRLAPENEQVRYGTTENAVFALLGLFLAFTFSGAGTRFDARRVLVVREANAIGTAWQRIDVLPASRQPAIRKLMRAYVDARLEVYQTVSQPERRRVALQTTADLQRQIWAAATQAATESGQSAPVTVMLPALNEMFDIAATRVEATRQHPPFIVYLMIGVLSLSSSAFVGFGMAGSKVRSNIHSIGFAASICVVLYVIVDIEYPRLGFVRIDGADRILIELRDSLYP